MAGVIGLDLAKVTGVAWIGRGSAPSVMLPWETWTVTLNPRGAVQGAHYFAFQKQLDEILRDWKPELVAYEEVQFIGKGKDAYRLNAILCGLVMVRCEAFAIPYVPVGVSTLKAFARAGLGNTKNGRPSKEDMAEFARVKLFETSTLAGPFPEAATHDHLDALWAAYFGVERLRRAA